MFGKKPSQSFVTLNQRSLIGESMQVEGDVHSTGAVDVAGLVLGNVFVDEMMIFDTGSVKGNLHVKKIDIDGHVEGEIIADVISLGSNAVVKGDIIFKQTLKTEEGCEIDGYIKGSRAKKSLKEEEDKDISEILPRAELGKPTLVKEGKKKEAV